MAVRVAVIDSGWDRSREDSRVLRGAAHLDPGRPDPDDHDRLGHGTACALELLRWAPAAAILPARVFGREAETSPEAVARAIRWAATARARVLCLSLGSSRADARAVLEPACAEALRAGAILVSAGPNHGPATCPADLPGVVGVWPARDLARGGLRRRPGGLELEAYAGARDGLGEGTSLAAAEVAGRLARLLGLGVRAGVDTLLDHLTGRAPPR